MDTDRFDEKPNEISRRSMLKRIGAGAAVAWTAPVLTSLRTPAFAESVRCTTCGACPPDAPFCADDCTCLRTTEGSCFCHQGSACSSLRACESSADCPAGWACAASCCGPETLCHPPCGTQAEAGVGPTSTGR